GQEVSVNIVVDDVSSVALSLSDGSRYTGEINASGDASVALETGSTWTLTGDSSVDSMEGDLTGIDLNGYVLTVAGAVYNG
ncbi:MAG: hypothetical protein IJV64_08590, partial [Oscillospiraceae bacterium]|nr:hypothetical protein [Oscillospiraceae bacterium]